MGIGEAESECALEYLEQQKLNDAVHDHCYPPTLEVASHAPDTNVLLSGPTDRLITSPVCPWKAIVCWPLSISHSPLWRRGKKFTHIQIALQMQAPPTNFTLIKAHQLISPEEVRIRESSRKRHDER